jgi:hypothetical protein
VEAYILRTITVYTPGLREVKTMPDHAFNFEGGEELRRMGATWFVSYSYYTSLDSTHRNWNQITTIQLRTSYFNRSTQLHRYWLQEVLNMSDTRLEKNEIGLTGAEVKRMARLLVAGAKTITRRSRTEVHR